MKNQNHVAGAAFEANKLARTNGVGAALFSGDLVLRALSGYRLFAMAAPAGGIILIAAWIGLAIAASL